MVMGMSSQIGDTTPTPDDSSSLLLECDLAIYRKSVPGQEFDLSVFRNPPAHYRGAPLWSWNNELHEEQLLRQIECMRDMGMGGFHIHSRTGLDTEYLGFEFMEMVQKCVLKGKEEGMLTWL
jgi:hypothetical protein